MQFSCNGIYFEIGVVYKNIPKMIFTALKSFANYQFRDLSFNGKLDEVAS